jgi:hypothetical protein
MSQDFKDPLRYDRNTNRQIQRPFLAQFLPDSLLGVCCNQNRTLVDELGMIRTQMGSTMDQKIVAVARDALYYTNW